MFPTWILKTSVRAMLSGSGIKILFSNLPQQRHTLLHNTTTRLLTQYTQVTMRCVLHGHQLCTPTMDTHHGHQLCTPTVDTHRGHQLCTPTMDTHRGHPSWTPTMYTHHGHKPCTPTVDTHCGHTPWTPTMDTNHMYTHRGHPL